MTDAAHQMLTTSINSLSIRCSLQCQIDAIHFTPQHFIQSLVCCCCCCMHAIIHRRLQHHMHSPNTLPETSPHCFGLAAARKGWTSRSDHSLLNSPAGDAAAAAFTQTLVHMQRAPVQTSGWWWAGSWPNSTNSSSSGASGCCWSAAGAGAAGLPHHHHAGQPPSICESAEAGLQCIRMSPIRFWCANLSRVSVPCVLAGHPGVLGGTAAATAAGRVL